MPPIPTRDELRAHLVRTRIAGTVDTPRQSNVRNYRLFAEGHPYYRFGMGFDREWTFSDVLDLMAERVGVDPDPRHVIGTDTIDPDRTIDALDAMAKRIGEAAARRERVLLATGHPDGLLGVYTVLGEVLREHGCTLLTATERWVTVNEGAEEPQQRRIRHVAQVAVVSGTDGRLCHTHAPQPMEAVLADLAARGVRPGFVIADHGWAGAAGQAGIETVGFADCNDPALFVGEAEGRIAVAVPLDDNVFPPYYEPLIGYLLDRAGLR